MWLSECVKLCNCRALSCAKHPQTLSALSHAIANFPIIYECGCLGTASWFVFKTLMHSCYFCVMHPGVILGLRESMLNGMRNVDTITSK